MKISLEEIKMDEKKPCNNCESTSVKEENSVETWFYRNRKIICAVACCLISYKLGYGKGRQEALSVIDHAVREVRDCFEIGKF